MPSLRRLYESCRSNSSRDANAYWVAAPELNLRKALNGSHACKSHESDEQMMKRSWVSLTLILFAMLGVACDRTTSMIAFVPTGPRSWIDAPLNGSTISLAPIDVVSHSTDPMKIVAVELNVNGAVIRTDPNMDTAATLATTRQQWVPPAPGDYTLQVRAQNSASVWGDYASKVVTVVAAPVKPPVPPVLPPVVVPPVAATAAASAVAPSPLPAVTIAFTVDKPSLVQGQCATIHWQVTNASQVFLDNATVNMSGSKQDCPTQNTTHTLRVVTLDKQTVQRTLTISVVVPTRTVPPPPPPPLQTGCSGTPNIASFSASPSSISAGGSSTLSWGAVTNANAVEIDQGIGGVAAPGSTSVSPGGTTTYTLTAHCGNNAASKHVTVTVSGASPPPPPQPPTFGNANSDQATFFFNSAKCGPKQVTISVSSANASGVRIYFRLADKASSGTTSWTQVPMSGSGGTWSRTFSSDTDIPGATSYFHAWFQFYLVATNASGDTTSAQYNNMVTLSNCAGIS